LQQKKQAQKQETEEERAVRLEALAIAAKEAAVRREEAVRQKLLDRQKHEQVRMPMHCMVALHSTDSMGLLHYQEDMSPSTSLKVVGLIHVAALQSIKSSYSVPGLA